MKKLNGDWLLVAQACDLTADMGVVMERWCPTQQMLGVFLKETVVKKLLLIGTIVLLTTTSAPAESPITYCISHGVNRASTWALDQCVRRVKWDRARAAWNSSHKRTSR
jgi:hypothetical protein